MYVEKLGAEGLKLNLLNDQEVLLIGDRHQKIQYSVVPIVSQDTDPVILSFL